MRKAPSENSDFARIEYFEKDSESAQAPKAGK
jgi:hypothetical protein